MTLVGSMEFLLTRTGAQGSREGWKIVGVSDSEDQETQLCLMLYLCGSVTVKFNVRFCHWKKSYTDYSFHLERKTTVEMAGCLCETICSIGAFA